jgi:hypothetical protein
MCAALGTGERRGTVVGMCGGAAWGTGGEEGDGRGDALGSCEARRAEWTAT